MQLNSRFAGGLAWAGLALVVGIPTLDWATSRLSAPASLAITGPDALAAEVTGTPVRSGSQPVVLRAAPARVATDPVETASIGPSAALADTSVPSYISEARPAEGTKSAVERSAVLTTVPADVTEKAVLPKVEPASQRDVASVGQSGVQVEQSAAPTDSRVAVASTQAEPVVIQHARPVIVQQSQPVVTESARPALIQNAQPQERSAASRDLPVVNRNGELEGGRENVATPSTEVASIAPVEDLIAPVPMPRSARPAEPDRTFAARNRSSFGNNDIVVPRTGDRDDSFDDEIVTPEDLAEWESGPLDEFLAARRERVSSRQNVNRRGDSFDSDGFWLDEGPNVRRQRGSRFER